MAVHPLAWLPSVRAVVATAGPGSPVLVRSAPGGGCRAVVEAASVVLAAEGHDVQAVPEIDALSESQLLDARRAARVASVLLGAGAGEPGPGAASLAAYLRPVEIVVAPLDVDGVRTVVEAVSGGGCDDEQAHRVRTWTAGRLDDVVDVAHHLRTGDDAAPSLAGFGPTAARLAGSPEGEAARFDPDVHRWAIAAAAGVGALAGSGPSPADRPVDAAALVADVAGPDRRRALRALVDAAAGLDRGTLGLHERLVVGAWWGELDEPELGPAELDALLEALGAAFTLNRNPDAIRVAARLWQARHEHFAAVGLVAALARGGPSALLDDVASVDDPVVADWVRFTRATWRFYCEHDPDAAVDLLTAGDDTSPPRGPAEQVLLDDALATFVLHLGRPGDAEAHLAPRLAADTALTPFAVNTLVLADIVRARHRRAIDRLAAELDSRLDPGPNLSSDRYRFFRAVAASQAGWVDLDPAAELEELYRDALDQGDEWTIGWVGWGAGVVAAREGRFDTARRRLRRSVDGFTRADRLGFASWAAWELDAVSAVTAPPPGARRPAPVDHPHHAVAFGRSAAELTRARTGRAAGAPAASVSAVLAGALATAHRQSEASTSVEICIEQVLAGLDAGEPVDDPAVDGVLIEVWPAVRTNTPERLEEAGARLLDCGWAVLGARVLARSAEIQRTRDPRQATRVLQLVRRAVAPFDQPLAPWALDPGVLPTLSPRELEVAGAVAGGASRDEVAAALVLSRRTVDSHLQRVYAKLGVSSRSELRSWLGERADR